MRHYFLFDTPNLCYSSYYGFQNKLKTKSGIPTSMIYGILTKLTTLTDTFNPKKVIFCFDSQQSLRKKLYPQYKGTRKHNPEIYQQIILTKKILFDMGFRNIFRKKGYEADDLLATIAREKTNSLIISADQDFYQCLSKTCSIYDIRQKKLITEGYFRKKYKITPQQWVDVKAIAGCSSDNVKGILGIGELSAIKYLKNIQFPKINSIKQGTKQIEFNRKLVELPFSPLKLKLKKDKLSISKLRRILTQYELYRFLQVEEIRKWKILIKNLQT